MRIAIEAQRIFRTNKHGMDFVALESIRELQKIDKENEYFIFVSPGEDHCLEETGQFSGAVLLVQCKRSGFILLTFRGSATCSQRG